MPDTVHRTLILQQVEDRIYRDALAFDEIFSLRNHVMIVSSANSSALNHNVRINRVLTVREKKALLLIKFQFLHKNFAPFKFLSKFRFYWS